MPTEKEFEDRFWKSLKSDMTMMIGLDGVEDGHARPMTAVLEGDRGGPIWFFTASDNGLVQKAGQHDRASATFTAKGHDLFATVHGRLSVDTNRAVVDRLWNHWIAAWYKGKDDPMLVLLRLDPERAEIWLDASSIATGIKLLFGADPREDYKDKVAEVRLG
jgi:general stress protein 26